MEPVLPPHVTRWNAPSSRSPLWTPSRRDLLKVAGVGGLGAALAACSGPSVGGGNEGDSSPTATEDFDWSAVTPANEITFWTASPANSGELEVQMVEAFNEVNPDIKVNIVTAGTNYAEIAQRFQAASSTDNLPDVVMASDVWWFRYFLNGQVMALDGVFEHLGVDTSDYVESLYNDYLYDGQHWAAPYARSTPLFYYNKSLWQAAGLPDRGPETWEEMAEWGPALQAVVPAEGAPFSQPISSDWAAWWFQSMLWGYGGQLSDEFTVTMDTPEALEAGGFVRDMYNGENAFAAVASDLNADFRSGLFASHIQSTGALRGHLNAIDFELGVSYLPAGPVAQQVPTGGTGLAVPSSRTPEQQLAGAMFIAFVTEAEQTALLSQGTGYMPVRTSAGEGEVMQALYEEIPQFKTSVDQLAEAGRSQDYVRVFVPGGDIAITEGLERIILEAADPEAVFAETTQRIETAFAENVEPYL